jgi:hypothetical protein
LNSGIVFLSLFIAIQPIPILLSLGSCIREPSVYISIFCSSEMFFDIVIRF